VARLKGGISEDLGGSISTLDLVKYKALLNVSYQASFSAFVVGL